MSSRAKRERLLPVALCVLLFASAAGAGAEEGERISCSSCHEGNKAYALSVVVKKWKDSACKESAKDFKINDQPAPQALAVAGTKALDARETVKRVLDLLAKEHDVPVNPEMKKVMVPVVSKGEVEEEQQLAAVGELNREFKVAADELQVLLDSPVTDSAGVTAAVDALDGAAAALQKIYNKARAVRTGLRERVIFGIVLLALVALFLAALVGRSALARGNVVEEMLSEASSGEDGKEQPEQPPASP